MTTDPQAPKKRDRMQRYRKRHRRIDYIPSRDVWKIVSRRQMQSGDSFCATIDALIREAVRPRFRRPGDPPLEPGFE